MIDTGEDGEMKLREEYCGKIQYLYEDYTKQSEEDLIIEIFMTEERKGPSR